MNELENAYDRGTFGVSRRTFMKLAGAAGVTAMGGMLVFPDAAYGLYTEPTNPNWEALSGDKVRFTVHSDTHFTKYDMKNKFALAFNTIYEQIPDVQAHVFDGDTTENGADGEYADLVEYFNKYIKKPPIICMGNHEMYAHGNDLPKAIQAFKNNALAKLTTPDTPQAPGGTHEGLIHFAGKVGGENGYWLIAASCGLSYDYGYKIPTEEDYGAPTPVQWMIQNIEAAVEEDPTKPVFVFTHHPMPNTVHYSPESFGAGWIGQFNDDVYTAKYVDDLETGDIGAITADPQITIKGGVFNGRFLTIKGDLTNSEILTPTEDENYDWMDVSGGTFTNPVEDRFLAPGFALTGNDGMYGVGQGHRIAFDVGIDGYDVEVTSADGTIEYGPEADGSYLLADGSYRAIFTASGYGATSIDFEVDGSDSTIPVKMSAVYGITITATPSEAEITIDGKSVENGIEVQLTEGTHKVTVSLDGFVTETFEITVGENGQTAYTVALDSVDDGPDYPPIIPGGDDDDVVIPPIYVPSDTSSSDDDTVKIVACAAAAVVAAIMAAFLIHGYRRD